MNLGLSDEQHAVREAFAEMFAKEATVERVRASEPLGFDAALADLMTTTGALGIGVPETAGGGGGGLLELALIAEEAGRRLAPVQLAEPAAAARLLAGVGDDSLLVDALNGRRLVTLAPSSRPLGDQLLPDGAVADVVITLEGDTLAAVDRPAAVRPVANFGSLPVARWNNTGAGRSIASGTEARRAYERARDDVRVLRAALLLGLAREAIDLGAGYARERHAFGVPIGTYQAVAHPLADALVNVDGGQLLAWKACWALDAAEPTGPALASMAIAFAARTAWDAAQHSLHIHGGYGFTLEYDIQLYYRRAKAWATVFSDPTRELQVVADRRFGPPRRRTQRVPLEATR
jgi:alkylation response protein AidB-like acyl-CoA dehydrogenase